ncbi:MAG TPA: 3-phosphoshikimate 1-carboxyvinyltransferase [Candidatus Omnitrophota bacterium]|nr:3-phosphoshikimate 1-carboxyvinyltransferase [Candidatus Omnitrophota bacterium]HQP11471.1 3-phosphoshikimate 1-carboxyvinyltransferase [Candidatus Omnitrophota bacterium]
MVIHPTPSLRGRVFLPASKSYSIRSFLIAACGGHSVIVHPSDCDDARVAFRVARFLGARVKKNAGNTWDIRAGSAVAKSACIDVGESGTVLRFLLPLLAAQGRKITVTGQGTLRGRPNKQLVSALRARGVVLKGTGPEESIPLVLSGGRFRGGEIRIDGTVSSQFISALCIACPQLPENTRLTVEGRRMVSVDYIEMTRLVLARAGVTFRQQKERTFLIPGGQTFRGLKRFVIPSDYGLAAFLIAAGLLTDSPLVLEGHFDREFIQADGKILEFLERMGVSIRLTSRRLSWLRPKMLRGGDFSLKDCPDLVPIMAVLALFAEGRTRLKDIQHARVKESNRITDLRQELSKAGARISETADTLTITPQPVYKRDVYFDPRHDHRLAMAFCVLGLKIGAVVRDIECVSKSYPGFVKDFKSVGVRLQKSSKRL